MAETESTNVISPRQKLLVSSWVAVVRTYQECNRRYTRMLQAFDLTTSQFDVLNAIDRLRDEAMPRVIAKELLVTRGNITGVLHRLKDREFIETREQEKDGRSFVCHLTATGTEALNRARAAASLFIDEQLAPFSDTELRQTEQQMNRMRSHLLTIDPETISAQVLRRAGRNASRSRKK